MHAYILFWPCLTLYLVNWEWCLLHITDVHESCETCPRLSGSAGPHIHNSIHILRHLQIFVGSHAHGVWADGQLKRHCSPSSDCSRKDPQLAKQRLC